jgi:hypothetical protein
VLSRASFVTLLIKIKKKNYYFQNSSIFFSSSYHHTFLSLLIQFDKEVKQKKMIVFKLEKSKILELMLVLTTLLLNRTYAQSATLPALQA